MNIFVLNISVKLKELKRLETFVQVSSLSLFWSWQLQDFWSSDVVECKVSYKHPTGEWNVSSNSYLIFYH